MPPPLATSIPAPYWGKAHKETDSWTAHLLAYHCLDVAAVANQILKNNFKLLSTIAKSLGLPKDEIVHQIPYLLSLHDLGKFANSFQNLVPDLLLTLQNRTSKNKYTKRHDTLGYSIWQEIKPKLLDHGLIDKQKLWGPSSIDVLMQASTGHHGVPPSLDSLIISEHFTSDDQTAAANHCIKMAQILLPSVELSKRLCNTNYANTCHSSWLIAGLAVLADWLGSNSNFFPFNADPEIGLREYNSLAQERAHLAIKVAGLIPSKPAPLTCFGDLFPKKVPSPLQQWCDQAIISNHSLYIIEDVTGSGKTEAALTLCHKIISNNFASGIYFALPTMATSNAMFERIAGFYSKLYAPEELPSLILAHAARDQNTSFVEIKSRETYHKYYGDGTLSANAYCNEWLADNTKKCMLANVGVGTIDQALSAALPIRHQSLRLVGLADKILVVDEVHACDSYMQELLRTLIRAHTSNGGTTILLSATLPSYQRQKLLEAFSYGLDFNHPTSEYNLSTKYPLLTQITATNKVEEFLIETRDGIRRELKIEWLRDQDSALKLLIEKAREGYCVCWIRNTVFDALSAYKSLLEIAPELQILLFHSRFALCDRLEIENKVSNNFGPNSNNSTRAGKILIATQVVEQSLDIDFDIMLTDLAPIDLIIQRAGRLQRHKRDINGNRALVENRPNPTLFIISPKANDRIKSNWYSSTFPKAARVYPDHGKLWLTASILESMGKFIMPDDARILIESVYSQNAIDKLPKALLKQSYKAEGEHYADTAQAKLNSITLSMGYTADGAQKWGEDTTPTRLGEASEQVCLFKLENGVILPWATDTNHHQAQSSLRLRKFIANKEILPNECTPKEAEELRNKYAISNNTLLLVLKYCHNTNFWHGAIESQDGKVRTVSYQKQTGLLLDTDNGE